MRKYILLFLIALGFASCANKKTNELQEQTDKGIVLIKNESYYELDFGKDIKFYFTTFDEKEGLVNLAMEKDSVRSNIGFGTGFFVTGDGRIATNYHVVDNFVNEKDVLNKWDEIRRGVKAYCSDAFDALQESKQQIKQQMIAKFYYDIDIEEERYYLSQIEEQEQMVVALYEGMDNLSANQANLVYHATVSIAYNDNHVTSSTDFQECVVIKKDAEHDLAVIQLKNKQTPQDKYVFAVPDADPLENYSWQDKLEAKISEDKNSLLFMNGFNLGPALGITDEGLKSQFNQGTVSQKTSDRLMYSIPALPGSSGSPIVNRKGELVAVNFAGIKETQNFNYGIRVKHLKHLLE